MASLGSCNKSLITYWNLLLRDLVSTAFAKLGSEGSTGTLNSSGFMAQHSICSLSDFQSGADNILSGNCFIN